MRFALLGNDEGTPALLDALRKAQHDLACAWACEALRGTLRALFPHSRWLESWVALLDAPDVDAVIMARGPDDDDRADILRRLAQVGAKVLASHPIHSSVLVYFELEMICAETKALIVPYAPARLHPGVQRCAAWIAAPADSPVGGCEQLVIERIAASRDDRATMVHFARDVDLALAMCGDLTSLAAMAPGWERTGIANLGVQMTGPAGALIRWSILPAESRDGVRLTLIGADGQVRLPLHWSGGVFEPTTLAVGETAVETFARWDGAAAALDAFIRALKGETAAPDWRTAARGMELADSIELSLRRGKTIQLYDTVPSERDTFKGIMASLGCLLLAGCLVVLPLALMLDALGIQQVGRVVAFIPYVLAALLIVYLLAQLLRLAFPRSP